VVEKFVNSKIVIFRSYGCLFTLYSADFDFAQVHHRENYGRIRRPFHNARDDNVAASPTGRTSADTVSAAGELRMPDPPTRFFSRILNAVHRPAIASAQESRLSYSRSRTAILAG